MFGAHLLMLLGKLLGISVGDVELGCRRGELCHGLFKQCHMVRETIRRGDENLLQRAFERSQVELEPCKGAIANVDVIASQKQLLVKNLSGQKIIERSLAFGKIKQQQRLGGIISAWRYWWL